LCYACPAWRWGTTCFAPDGDALRDAVRVSALGRRPGFPSFGPAFPLRAR
jgi:hypothetical protein